MLHLFAHLAALCFQEPVAEEKAEMEPIIRFKPILPPMLMTPFISRPIRDPLQAVTWLIRAMQPMSTRIQSLQPGRPIPRSVLDVLNAVEWMNTFEQRIEEEPKYPSPIPIPDYYDNVSVSDLFHECLDHLYAFAIDGPPMVSIPHRKWDGTLPVFLQPQVIGRTQVHRETPNVVILEIKSTPDLSDKEEVRIANLTGHVSIYWVPTSEAKYAVSGWIERRKGALVTVVKTRDESFHQVLPAREGNIVHPIRDSIINPILIGFHRVL